MYKNVVVHCAPHHDGFRDGDENDRICPRSWSALNHRDGPRTVDFVLDGIADFVFSLWAALYMIIHYFDIVNTTNLT